MTCHRLAFPTSLRRCYTATVAARWREEVGPKGEGLDGVLAVPNEEICAIGVDGGPQVGSKYPAKILYVLAVFSYCITFTLCLQAENSRAACAEVT